MLRDYEIFLNKKANKKSQYIPYLFEVGLGFYKGANLD